MKENDFLFEDLSRLGRHMDAEETAARYLAAILKLPFDAGITEKFLMQSAMRRLQTISTEEVSDINMN